MAESHELSILLARDCRLNRTERDWHKVGFAQRRKEAQRSAKTWRAWRFFAPLREIGFRHDARIRSPQGRFECARSQQSRIDLDSKHALAAANAPSVRPGNQASTLSDCRPSAPDQATKPKPTSRLSFTKSWLRPVSRWTRRLALLWSRASVTISATCGFIQT